MTAPIIDTVYFDMDGVLVDDMLTLAALEGKTLLEVEIARAAKKAEDPHFDYVVYLIRKHLYQNKCFATALETPEFPIFYSIIKHLLRKRIHVEILSSGTRQLDIFQECCDQKRIWLSERNLDIIPQHYAFGAREKQKWAQPNVLLIDDYDKNVREFIAAGGNAIQHSNINDTIVKLQALHLI